MRILDRPLEGITIAIPESRFGAEFAEMFQRLGARVHLCPLTTETVLADRTSTRTFVDLAVSGGLDLVIFMTGVGTNLIFSEAEVMGKKQALLDALANLTILSRGSKSTAALRKANVHIDIIPSTATTEGVIDALRSHDITGKRIAVQLYGTPNPVLSAELEGRGATVIPVSVYTYSPASDLHEIELLIQDLIRGPINIIVFTSAPQVHALFETAANLGETSALHDSLVSRTQVASIGEVTTRALEQYGVRPHIVPEQPKMGPMVKAICTTRS
jgi:uroporphyrinogen-III synthase